MIPRALTIAATDSGGGAGVAADLATFAAHRVWGTLAVTAVTVQDTLAVHAVHVVPAPTVRAQIDVVARDIGAGAVKTGVLATAEQVETVAAAVRDHGLHRLVVDPVLVASTGDALAAPDAAAALTATLLPLADLVTPNLAEAGTLAGGGTVAGRSAMEEAARAILASGCRAVLVTGGHLDGPTTTDLLLVAGGPPVWLEGRRVVSANTHGTGCVLSAAIAARLAHGDSLEAAVRAAKEFVVRAIGRGVALGKGAGAVRPW